MAIIRDLNKEREESFWWCCANYRNSCCTIVVVLVVYFIAFPLFEVGYDAVEEPVNAQVAGIQAHMGPHEKLINGTMCMPAQPQVLPYIFQDKVSFDPCSQSVLSSSCCPQSRCDASKFLTCKENDDKDCLYAGMACYTPTEYSMIHKGNDDDDNGPFDSDDWPILVFIIVVIFMVCCNDKKVANKIKTAASRVRSKWDTRYKDSGGDSPELYSNKDYVHTYQMVEFDDYSAPNRGGGSNGKTNDNDVYNDRYWRELEGEKCES